MKQHIIPECYLKAWCDPNTPNGYEPYLWLIEKDGKKSEKKAPKKTFRESEMYSIKLPTGDKDLAIEETLSRIEDKFIEVMKNKIEKRSPLNLEERIQLCLFVSAMSIRTKAQQRNKQQSFDDLHELVVAMEKYHKAEPITSKVTKILSDTAHQTSIELDLQIKTPFLMQMSMAIFMSEDDNGFITSDNPYVMINPAILKPDIPPLLRIPALGQKKVEVTLPLTPNYCLLLSWGIIEGYIETSETILNEINRRTRLFCDKHFISRNGIQKLEWFDLNGVSFDITNDQLKDNSSSRDCY